MSDYFAVWRGVGAAASEPQVTKRRQQTRETDDTFVVDQLFSHGRAEDDSCWLLRVRWAA
jgi:hypothetical protein